MRFSSTTISQKIAPQQLIILFSLASHEIIQGVPGIGKQLKDISKTTRFFVYKRIYISVLHVSQDFVCHFDRHAPNR